MFNHLSALFPDAMNPKQYARDKNMFQGQEPQVFPTYYQSYEMKAVIPCDNTVWPWCVHQFTNIKHKVQDMKKQFLCFEKMLTVSQKFTLHSVLVVLIKH
jgi:hypothetical protein